MRGGQCPGHGGPPVSVDCENLDVKFMGPHRYWQSESGIVILDIIVHTTHYPADAQWIWRKKIPNVNRT